jgi:hypothetical protein
LSVASFQFKALSTDFELATGNWKLPSSQFASFQFKAPSSDFELVTGNLETAFGISRKAPTAAAATRATAANT